MFSLNAVPCFYGIFLRCFINTIILKAKHQKPVFQIIFGSWIRTTFILSATVMEIVLPMFIWMNDCEITSIPFLGSFHFFLLVWLFILSWLMWLASYKYVVCIYSYFIIYIGKIPLNKIITSFQYCLLYFNVLFIYFNSLVLGFYIIL